MDTRPTYRSRVLARFSIGLLAYLFIFPSFSPAEVFAEVFNVTSTSDAVDALPGDGICDVLPPDQVCTLRAAIQEANRYPGIDVILVPAGIFTLTIAGDSEDQGETGDLDILEGVSLSGDRFGGTIIQAGESGGGLGDRVFHVLAPSVTLRQVTVRNGSGDAAGILVNAGSFRLVDVHVTGNQGKGVSGTGGMTLVEGSVSNNTGDGIDFTGSSLNLSRFSNSGNGGAGIRSVGGTLLLRDTDISGNAGGGVVLEGGTLTLSGGVLRGNSSSGSGAGIFAGSSTVSIRDSLIEGNSSQAGGGGIYQTGTLTLVDTSIIGNQSLDGGGIFQEGSLFMSGSTVGANSASGSGGGIFKAGGFQLTGSTISGNTADAFGGGIFYDEFSEAGEFDLNGSTVTENRSIQGGGLYVSSANPVRFKNSILALNEVTRGSPDCHFSAGATAESLGYNLFGETEGCSLTPGPGDLLGTVTDPVDPLLEPLSLNGGSTPTHLPISGSPVIDSGNPTGCTDSGDSLLEADQRGFTRHVDGGGGLPRCDMGAVEFDAPGITVTPLGGLETPESGGYAQFALVLESRPTSEVLVEFWSSDPTQGTPSPEFAVFDQTNWSETQTIRVDGQDDLIQDGDVFYTIHADPAISADPKYSGFDPEDVVVKSIDNDTAGVFVTPVVGLVTSELGASAVFSVVLKSQPVKNVTLAFSVSEEDGTEGKVSPTSLIFTPQNWDVPQPVTVTGVDDFIVDGLQIYTVITAPAESEDPVYQGINPEDVLVGNIDDDSPGITITPTLGLVTTESGGTDTFTVVLHSRPAAPVSISFESDNPEEGIVSPDTLVFGDDNWNSPQPVTVIGVDDVAKGNPWDGDRRYTVISKPALSPDDPEYHGKNPRDVEVVNRDNDVRGISINLLTELFTSEFGGKAKFSVVLDYPPTADVSISFESSDPSEGIVEPDSVTFNPDNWDQIQVVEVIGVNDEAWDDNITYTVYIHPAVSGDSLYHQMDPDNLTLVNLDRESRAVPNSGDPIPGGTGGCGFIQGGGPGGPTLPFLLSAGLAILLLQRLLRIFPKTRAFR